MRERLAWALVAASGLVTTLTLAGVVSGGPLDPLSGPGPTMKTLDDVPPIWSRALPADDGPPCASSRFDCVLGDAAVLDRETGLVWHRSAAVTPLTWDGAYAACWQSSIGGRFGWRLPTAEEFKSLLIVGGGLPSGHPFDVPSGTYWTASTIDGASALAVSTSNPAMNQSESRLATFPRLCVRGATGLNPER